MDANRFDALSRLVAVATTRRRLVATAAAALLGDTLANAVDAAARPAICRPGGRYCTRNHQCCNNQCRTGKRFPHRTRNVCECTSPDGWCNSECTNLGIDRRNAGSCRHVCLPGEVCHDGACWRQLGQTCDRPNLHGHECDIDLLCNRSDKICVGQLDYVGCGDDDDLCEDGLVCRDDTCLEEGLLGEVCEQDSDCDDDFLRDEEIGECVPAC